MSKILTRGSASKSSLNSIVTALSAAVETARVGSRIGGGDIASLESINDSVLLGTMQDMATELDNEIQSAFGVESFSEGGVSGFRDANKQVITMAQREAAAIVGLASANPMDYVKKGYRKVSEISTESADKMVHAVSVGAAGELDFRNEPCVGIEAFNETELRAHIPFSIAFNFQAARQDDFSEAFYPTLVVTPDQAGLDIAIRRPVVFNAVRHNVTGTAADFKRRSIVDAFVDYTILENESTYLVPAVIGSGANQNTTKFSSVVGTASVDVEGVAVITAPLKANTTIDLLGISNHPGLVDSGIIDHTDDIDGRLALKKAYFVTAGGGSEAVAFNTLKMPRSGFVKSTEGDGREMSLQFFTSLLVSNDTKAVDGSSVGAIDGAAVPGVWNARLGIKLAGSANLETGNVSVGSVGTPVLVSLVNGDGVKIDTTAGAGAALKAVLEAMTFDSYELEARRTNANKRTRGLLVDSQQYVERYTIPLGSPISTPAPIGTTRDSADMQNLITTARIRNSNNAVTQILNYAATLREQVAIGEAGIDAQIEGIGRFLVKPWFEEATVDVVNDINSVSSHERAADLSAILINSVRDMAYRAYSESRYQAALNVLTGGQGLRPRLVIGTDQVIIRHLMIEGDSRLVGLAFDHVVVASMDSRMDGKIVFSFVRADVTGEPDPLSFGIHAWIPELTSTVQMNRNGATYKETMVQPRSRHINVLPILGLIHVENLAQGLLKKASVDVNLNNEEPLTVTVDGVVETQEVV